MAKCHHSDLTLMAESQRFPLPLAALTAALEQPLALVEDEAQRQKLRAYLDLVRVHLERSLVTVLSDVAARVNAAQTQVEARVQFENGNAEWVLEPKEVNPAQEAAWFASGDQEKVTIRIPSELKELIGLAAGRSGLSVNSWYIRMLAGAMAGLESDKAPFKAERTGTRGSPPEPPKPPEEPQGMGRKFKGIIGR
jgi:hypothetical protein